MYLFFLHILYIYIAYIRACACVIVFMCVRTYVTVKILIQ